MTVTPQPPRGARRRAFAAAVVAALLALAPAAAGPAAAATATPEPTDAASVEPGVIDLTLAPVRSGVLDAGDSLTVAMKLDNGTESVVPASEVTLAIGTEPLRTRIALSDWLAGSITDADVAELARTTLSAANPLESSSRSLTVPSSAGALQDLAPGIYPLVATAATGGDPAISTSAVVVPDPDAVETPTVVIVPITSGPRTTGLLSAAELRTLTAFDGSLTAQLAAARGTTAVLAIDPAIPAAIRALGDSAPTSAQDWLEDLLALPNDRFALQFGDADPGVQIEAGSPDLLEPSSLAAYLNPNDFSEADAASEDVEPTPVPTPEATEAPVDGAPGLPTLDELLDVGDVLTGWYWPAETSVTAETVAALDSLDPSAEARTVLASRSTGAGSAGSTVGAAADTDAGSLLVYDADSSSALSAAAASDDPIDRSASLASATAHLAFAAAQSAGRPIAIAFDRGALPTRTGATLAMSAVEAAPGIATTSLAALTDASPRRVTIADAEPDTSRVAAVTLLAAGEREISQFATILEDPAVLTGPERAEILQLLGTAWTDDAVAADLAVAGHREAVRETLDSVALLPTSDITLAGSTASLRFWVRNDLPYPADVMLLTSSDNLRLSVDSAIPVAATANSNTRVVVPVQARIGNGQVALDLQLYSPSGVAIGSTQTVQVNVRAEWEGVGIAVLSVLVGGLVVVGAVRTVLRLRARRRDAVASPSAGETDERETTAPPEDGS